MTSEFARLESATVYEAAGRQGRVDEAKKRAKLRVGALSYELDGLNQRV